MKSFIAKVGLDTNLGKKLTLDENKVLSTICYLSSHLRLICGVFNVPHPSSKIGWIIEPAPKINSLQPSLPIKEIEKIIVKFIKQKYLLSSDDPFAVLPNADQIIETFDVKMNAVEITSDSLICDEWSKLSSDEYWKAIPGVSDGLPKMSLTKFVEAVQSQSDWAKQYPQLANAPPVVLDASFLVFQKTGFIPESNDWLAAVTMLLRMANNDMKTLSEGLDKGQEMRKTVSMTSVRSFQGAVREVAASKRIVTGTTSNKQRIVQ